MRNNVKTIFMAVVLCLAKTSVFAMAQAPHSGGEAPPWYVQLIPIAGMFGIFYFLLIRPQSKQRAERQKMIDALKKGDRIVTQGGFIATVVSLNGPTLDVKLNEETKVKLLRSAVSDIYSEPADVKVAEVVAPV